ncbi:jg3630 [Pararge aegeria aegeria]|uniref:Jg3630 protein n=2 Tax=Pararge aegeria TaxID=116150 RepID=A0A8S4RES0_9NEOP|nr:jg3630 [Pararge aegeria aegeria]
MDVVEEENPLQINVESSGNIPRGFRNIVGRPTRNHEILFSAPPKSMISLLLREEKIKELEGDQNETTVKSALKEKTVKKLKKWTCDYCSDRIFFKKSEYRKHIKTHKVYKCDQADCSYMTNFTSNLKTHKRIHTSDYPYVCEECTFRSKFINSLKAHKRLHNRERPFECQHCEYKCNSGSNLKKHCTRKHPNIQNNSDNPT